MKRMNWFIRHKWFSVWLIIVVVGFIVVYLPFANPFVIGQLIGYFSVFYWTILRWSVRFFIKDNHEYDDIK